MDRLVVGGGERPQVQPRGRQLHSGHHGAQRARPRRDAISAPVLSGPRASASRPPAMRSAIAVLRRSHVELLRARRPAGGARSAVSPPQSSQGPSSECASEPGNRLHRVSPHCVHRTASIERPTPRVACGHHRTPSICPVPALYPPRKRCPRPNMLRCGDGGDAQRGDPPAPAGDRADGGAARASGRPVLGAQGPRRMVDTEGRGRCGEDPRACARREFAEETGARLCRRARSTSSDP